MDSDGDIEHFWQVCSTVAWDGHTVTDSSNVGFLYVDGNGGGREITLSVTLVAIAANPTYDLTVSIGNTTQANVNASYFSANIARLDNVTPIPRTALTHVVPTMAGPFIKSSI